MATKADFENALRDLLDALDKQCFPPGAEQGKRMRYSMNVEDAITTAQKLFGAKPVAPEPRNVARSL